MNKLKTLILNLLFKNDCVILNAVIDGEQGVIIKNKACYIKNSEFSNFKTCIIIKDDTAFEKEK